MHAMGMPRASSTVCAMRIHVMGMPHNSSTVRAMRMHAMGMPPDSSTARAMQMAHVGQHGPAVGDNDIWVVVYGLKPALHLFSASDATWSYRTRSGCGRESLRYTLVHPWSIVAPASYNVTIIAIDMDNIDGT